MSIRTLIVDDHEVVRSGLGSLLAGSEVEVIGEVGTGAEALKSVETKKPDVVLLDIRLPEMDGLSVLEQLSATHPETKVIILSTYDNPTYMARAWALGAKEYVLKGASRQELIDTIRAVKEGAGPLEGSAMQRVARTMASRQKTVENDISLTQRETQVLKHLALGLSNKEISSSLSISVETVKEHVQHLLRKLHANDRTQAAVWAVRRGMV